MLVVFGIAAVFANVVMVPAWLVPASQVPDAVKRVELQNSVRTTLVQGMGALLLAAGAFFTWRQIQLNRDQLRHSLDSSTAQLRLSREGQITEQFSRALEHLGHSKPGIRVGAIYALEQIAKTAPEIRPAIHELLADYVRTEAIWTHHDPVTFQALERSDADLDVPLLKLRAADVQAAVTVLGRRTECPDEILELQNVDLRRAYLGGAKLRRAIIGRAMLAGVNLSDADLSAAHLRRTNFRNSILRNATLAGANLEQTDLRGADLSGADLSDADFRQATCDDATIWPETFDSRAAGVRHEG